MEKNSSSLNEGLDTIIYRNKKERNIANNLSPYFLFTCVPRPLGTGTDSEPVHVQLDTSQELNPESWGLVEFVGEGIR